MSTDTHNTGHGSNGAPVNSDVTFEPRDINVSTVVKQLIYLAITIALALVICKPILGFLTRLVADNDQPMPPVRAEMNEKQRAEAALPEEPRLQGVPGHTSDPQQDLRDKIAADEAANESYGWTDKAQGVARIPVSEAMKIIAEKGASAGAAAPGKKK